MTTGPTHFSGECTVQEVFKARMVAGDCIRMVSSVFKVNRHTLWLGPVDS